MALGDILVDGKKPAPRLMKDMCEEIVAFFELDMTGEELFNSDVNGELYPIFSLYDSMLAAKGHRLEIELPDSKIHVLCPGDPMLLAKYYPNH